MTRLVVLDMPAAEKETDVCGWCGRGVGDFFDDLGNIYITPMGDDTRPTCEGCYLGEPGRRHVARFGVGDR